MRVQGRRRRSSARPQPEILPRTQKAETHFRAILESLLMTVYVAALDVQGAFTYVSPQVERLLGYTPKEWMADRGLWLKRLHPEDRRRVMLALARSHRDREGFHEEYRLLDREGRERWIKDDSRPVRDAEGRPLFIQGTWVEITGHKELERVSAGESRRLAMTQREMSELVSLASHELAAPLRRIVNLGDTLARRAGAKLDAESRAVLARMTDSAARAQRLVRGLVAYAQEGRGRAASSPVELGEVLDRASGDLRDLIEETGAVVSKGPMPRVLADAALLERVLYNLLDNALKFRGALPPRINVSALRSGAAWIVSVADNGPGVAPAAARDLFAPDAGPRLARRSDGEGIGLAICQKLVQLLGGQIWMDSEPGEGTTVSFTLPAAPEADA
ncbi:MAG: PAS domain-containing protein [Elusimicrobia bacterium]|nr:PAS domain-containing protein [Elusimicrobiota bacterium]